MKKLGLVALICVLSLGAFAQQKKDDKKDKADELKASDVTISVIKDTNGKPVRNASVVLHPVDEHGKQDSGGINLKTDQDGKTGFQGLPYGKLRIQVIARGFQTFGQDFDINQPALEIVVKLKPPAGQYSIYEDKPNQTKQ